MVKGNTPKLAAVVLLLSIGATAYAISKSLGALEPQSYAPAVSTASDVPDSGLSPDNGLSTEDSQSIRKTNSSSLAGEAVEETALPETRTIAAVTKSEHDFSILAVALETAGLTDMLSEEGPFTVFAPTDDAFYSLPPGQLEALLQPENREQLVALLTHHVVEGKVLSSDFRSGDIHAVDDETLDVSLDGNVKVNGAHVVEIDIPASNGVIHAVDAVIVPEQVSSNPPIEEQSSDVPQRVSSTTLPSS